MAYVHDNMRGSLEEQTVETQAMSVSTVALLNINI